MVKAFKRNLSPKKGTEYGLIIADTSESVSERMVAKTVYKTARRYAAGKGHSSVFDSLFFKDSRLEPVIQLADMVGHVVHKHEEGDPAFSSWYERLKLDSRNSPL